MDRLARRYRSTEASFGEVMLDQFSLVGLSYRTQQVFGGGGVAHQVERFFKALVFRQRHHHDVLAVLTGRHERSPALADGVKCFLRFW